MLTCPVSSFAMNTCEPSWLSATPSGSEPARSTRSSVPAAVSTSPMPSAPLSGGGSFDSSTPGPAIGEPLSATYKRDRSVLATMPRGRLPSSRVPNGSSVSALIIVSVPARSFVT